MRKNLTGNHPVSINKTKTQYSNPPPKKPKNCWRLLEKTSFGLFPHPDLFITEKTLIKETEPETRQFTTQFKIKTMISLYGYWVIISFSL